MTDDSMHEERLIKDSARRFLTANHTFEERCKIIAEEPGYSASQWREMAELGWMLLPLSSELGGLGGDIKLLSTLHKELGRSLHVSPFLSSAVIATLIIERTRNESLRTEILRAMSADDTIVSPAIYEPQSRYELENIATTASENHGELVLNGHKCAVLYGNVAAQFLVLARIKARDDQTHRHLLCLMPSDQDGVSMTHYRTHDGGRLTDMKLNRVRLHRSRVLLDDQSVLPVIRRTISAANALLCAELVGGMEATLEMTLEYLRTRSQFGRKLASFQALQHRAVDMFMRCQLAESMRREAACAFESTNETAREMTVSAAKCEIARAALLNAEEAIQLHGAMGMMDEMPVGHYLKRVFTLNMLFGNADYHRARYRTLRLRTAGG